jgi:adenylosuccinate lyase
MDKRYENPKIKEIWELIAKFFLWQRVELAVIEARADRCLIPEGVFSQIKKLLEENPIDVNWILEREQVLHHDLNAFLEERLRFLPAELGRHFHQDMTSYDTEEPAFAISLTKSCGIVASSTVDLLAELKKKALEYRYTPMNARTHGQEAEMQSFGKCCLNWYQDLRAAYAALVSRYSENLRYSKLSGAIGTNSGIDPLLEETALGKLGLSPWRGATQIMPRILYAPIAQALANLVSVLDKIAVDIRLGARSGRPLWHEPFGKQQKGSSAMPHKKNTIIDENTGGMAKMARAYASGIGETIGTWECRDITQSSVERVFWPDLFHVTLQAIKNMTKVISGLVVYPDNMYIEIIESRETYASSKAKELLVELAIDTEGNTLLNREGCYRIVQLACFNAFEPTARLQVVRDNIPQDLKTADVQLNVITLCEGRQYKYLTGIGYIISNNVLKVSNNLDIDQDTVNRWNRILEGIFRVKENMDRWNSIFQPSTILANEAHIFKEVFGE